MSLVKAAGYVLKNKKNEKNGTNFIFEINGPDIPADSAETYCLYIDNNTNKVWSQKEGTEINTPTT